MAQIIHFPGTPLAHAQKVAVVAAKALTTKVAPSERVVIRPIRKYVRVPKKPRREDLDAADIARMAKCFAAKAEALDPSSADYRLMRHMAGIDHKLPKNNLRCIVSTLDEERDFDLRCAEVDVLRAEHELECKREDLRLTLDPSRKRDLGSHWTSWENYRARVLELAKTPARTYWQLDRKRRIIGKVWLTAPGDWCDRLRAGCETDEAWLAENRPKRRKGAKQ